MDRLTTCRRAAPALLSTLLAACGGGGDPGTPLPSDPERTAAATATAQSASNDCAAIHPFYWEVGHASARVASGSVGGSTHAGPGWPTRCTRRSAATLRSCIRSRNRPAAW